MNESEVIQFLIDTARQRPSILGTHLGTALTKAFPDLRGNPRYPGLKRFIQTHCANRLVRIGDHGGDDVYQYAPDGGVPPEVETAQGFPSAWDVFQRPNAEGHLFVNTSNGELHVAVAEEPAKENLVRVSSVTDEEHRLIAQEYLERVSEESRSMFLAALGSENYWPQWSRLVNKPPYKQDWSVFRFSKLCDLFRTRLRGSGLSDTLVAASLKHLLQGKKGSELGKKEDALRPTGVGSRLDSVAAATNLRRLVHAAIDSMSDNELRRLWLPLGDVLDAIRVPHH